MSPEKDLLSLACAGAGSSFMQAQWSIFFSKFIIHLKNKKSLRLSIPLPRTVRLVGVGSWGVPVGGVYVMFGWGLPSAGRRLSVGVFWEKLNEGPIFKLCSQQKVDNSSRCVSRFTKPGRNSEVVARLLHFFP